MKGDPHLTYWLRSEVIKAFMALNLFTDPGVEVSVPVILDPIVGATPLS